MSATAATMGRYKYFVPVAVFAGLLLMFFSGLWRDPAKLPSALVGKPVPVFDLPPLPGADGQRKPGLKSDDLKGEASLVNVFASWCIPCKLEHPILMRMAERERIPINGINYKDKPDDAIAWLETLGNPYTRIGADRDGRVGIDFGVYGVPETYIVDREGRVRYRQVGPITPEDLKKTILPIVEALRRP